MKEASIKLDPSLGIPHQEPQRVNRPSGGNTGAGATASFFRGTILGLIVSYTIAMTFSFSDSLPSHASAYDDSSRLIGSKDQPDRIRRRHVDRVYTGVMKAVDTLKKLTEESGPVGDEAVRVLERIRKKVMENK